MAFFFDEKEGDPLMTRINLRDIGSRAKQWDHPMKGMFKYAEAMAKNGGDVLKLSKKDRERYCVSLVGLALQKDSNLEWWTHMPNPDPPDGLVMTLRQEAKSAKGYMRNIEVVEHRSEPNKIFDVIRDKMVENVYESNSVLVCLSLTPGVYNFEHLSARLAGVTSSLKHVFVVFAGSGLGNLLALENVLTTYSLVQLRPVFQQTTFDYRPDIEDFKKRYERGQESRLIEGNTIYFGTSNPKFIDKK